MYQIHHHGRTVSVSEYSKRGATGPARNRQLLEDITKAIKLGVFERPDADIHNFLNHEIPHPHGRT